MPDPRDVGRGRVVPTDIPGKFNRPGQKGRVDFPSGGGTYPPAGGPVPGPQAAPESRNLSIPPWFNVRPDQAEEIGPVRVFAPGFTAANTPAVLPGSAVVLPSSRLGVVKSVSFAVNQLLLTSQIFFTLLINGGPVIGWNNIQIYQVATPFFLTSYPEGETSVFLPEASTFSVQVNVTDAGTYQLGADYHGWHVDTRLNAIFAQAYRF